jgi:hypothetical protein
LRKFANAGLGFYDDLIKRQSRNSDPSAVKRPDLEHEVPSLLRLPKYLHNSKIIGFSARRRATASASAGRMCHRVRRCLPGRSSAGRGTRTPHVGRACSGTTVEFVAVFGVVEIPMLRLCGDCPLISGKSVLRVSSAMTGKSIRAARATDAR